MKQRAPSAAGPSVRDVVDHDNVRLAGNGRRVPVGLGLVTTGRVVPVVAMVVVVMMMVVVVSVAATGLLLLISLIVCQVVLVVVVERSAGRDRTVGGKVAALARKLQEREVTRVPFYCTARP